jgi:stearoyl-CoA desaturase (delta-9 desaturase)
MRFQDTVRFMNHALWIAAYCILMSHLTITAMSLSFHRQHTHQGVKLHPAVDFVMQTWLWLFTSMSKRDWVSVHVYHHAHSDDERDPHSPVQKGLWNIFFLGVPAYSRAKHWPEVRQIRRRLAVNRWEAYFERNLFVGPVILVGLNLCIFGPLTGGLVSLFNFAISPLFAVGGVNGLAHYVGYRNHVTRDNSRNLGFLVLLNWIVCGELDHNNHHHSPKSCSFRHRWFEFDIGFLYLRVLSWIGLAELKHVYRKPARARV